MTRLPLPLLALTLACTLAGCDRRQPTPPPDGATATPAPAPAPAPAPPPAPSPSAPSPSAVPTAADALPGPTDRDPTHALAYWRAAMEGHDWADARRVFGNSGADSGMTPEQFARAWGKYRIVDVTVGTGEEEGAAGSSYYEVPVTITGLTVAGKPYHLAGRLTLRRVNDVDGATPEQLRWHIERSTLRP